MWYLIAFIVLLMVLQFVTTVWAKRIKSCLIKEGLKLAGIEFEKLQKLTKDLVEDSLQDGKMTEDEKQMILARIKKEILDDINSSIKDLAPLLYEHLSLILLKGITTNK